MTNLSIPPLRYHDIQAGTPRTRAKRTPDDEARAYHNMNRDARRRVDVPVCMPQAIGLRAGSVVYLRWSAVPEDKRPHVLQHRTVRGVVRVTNNFWSSVSWDGAPAVRVPAAWLALGPEWT